MIEHQWEHAGLVRRHVGIVTGQDIERSDVSIHSDPRFSGMRYIIEDFRGCASLQDLDQSALKELAAASLNPMHGQQSIRHAVVTSRPLGISLVQAFTQMEQLSCPVQKFVFMADARDWTMAEGCP